MATHSSILAWRVPWTENGRLHAVPRVIKSQTRLKPLSMHTRNYARYYLWGKLLEKFIDFICTGMRVNLLLCQTKRFLKITMVGSCVPTIYSLTEFLPCPLR